MSIVFNNELGYVTLNELRKHPFTDSALFQCDRAINMKRFIVLSTNGSQTAKKKRNLLSDL